MRKHRRSESAVSLVEFAIVAPLFLILVFVVLDFGKYLYIRNTIDTAAREGARRAILFNNPTTSDVETVIKAHASDVSLASPCAFNSPSPPPQSSTNSGYVYLSKEPAGGNGTYTGCSGTKAGHHTQITVSISYRYTPITPLLSSIIGTITYTATSTMTTEY